MEPTVFTPSKKYSGILSFLACCVLLVWVLLQANRIFPQVQALLLGGSVPFPSFVLKVLLVALLFVTVFVRRNVIVPSSFVRIWSLFAVYLLFQFFYHQSQGEFSSFSLLFGFNANFSFFLIFPLFFAVNGVLSLDKILSPLAFLTVIFVLLGFFQYLSNDPVLPLKLSKDFANDMSLSGTLQVMSYDFSGQIRAFSLFDSSSRFGCYLVFFLSVILSCKRCNKGLFFLGRIVLIMMVFACVYMTLTRLVYLQTIAILTTYAIFHMDERFTRRYMIWLPVGYGLAALSLVFLLPLLAKFLSADVRIFSSSSFYMRLEQWQESARLWCLDLPTFLFGTGLIENPRFLHERALVIDNSYIAYGVQAGLLGLVLYLVMMWQLWVFSLSEAFKRATPLSVGSACTLSAWPVVAMFGMTGAEYALLLLPLILSGVEVPPTVSGASFLSSASENESVQDVVNT